MIIAEYRDEIDEANGGDACYLLCRAAGDGDRAAQDKLKITAVRYPTRMKEEKPENQKAIAPRFGLIMELIIPV